MATTTALSDYEPFTLGDGPIPVEVYLRCFEFEPDAEYVDGYIEKRPVGEFGHSSWQNALQQWFGQHSKEWNIRVRPELRVQVASTRYRVPDVVVFSRNIQIDKILKDPPTAVFEVLSPEDRPSRMKKKLDDYARMGTRTIIVINPDSVPEAISEYVDGQLRPFGDGRVTIPGSPCFIDWDGVREFLD